MDVFDAWNDWPGELPELVSLSAAARPVAVAGRLRRRVPGALFAGCRIDGHAAVEGGDATLLGGVTAAGEAPLGGGVGLAAAVGLRGLMVVGLPTSAPEAEKRTVRALLGLAAHALGLALEADRWRSDQADSAALAVVAEALAGLGPKIGQGLNGVAFRAAALQLKVDPSLRESLEQLRAEGLKVAALLRPLHLLREGFEDSPLPRSDLFACLAEVLAEPMPDDWLRCEADPTLPPVYGTPAALRRLVLMLMRVATALPGRQGTLVLAAHPEGANVVLRLTAPGATPPAGAADELPVDAVTGLEEVDRLALLALVRRLGARLELRHPETTLAVVWPGSGSA